MNLERESFFYEQGKLVTLVKGDKVPLSHFVKGKERPVYLYNTETIKKRINAYKDAFKNFNNHVHYAVKANSNLDVLKLMKSEGFGADVVSIGEFNQALKAGFSGANIIFSGVGKSRLEIKEALEKNVFQINCESLSELKRVAEVSKELGKTTHVGVRINPDIPVDTHPYIATGFRENKFGISLNQLQNLSKLIKETSGVLKLKGISCHIGSQIMDIAPLVKALESVLRVERELSGLGHKIEFLDLGGGLGVDYQSDREDLDLDNIQKFGNMITPLLKNFKGQVLFEPGRSLVARSGVLLTRVEYIKTNGYKDFVVVNSGMHHLLRPSLYNAFHKIVPLVKREENSVKTFDVVGPICESSDVLGHDRSLNVPEEGDWLAVMDAGAYGMSMASGYNLHAFPEEVLV